MAAVWNKPISNLDLMIKLSKLKSAGGLGLANNNERDSLVMLRFRNFLVIFFCANGKNKVIWSLFFESFIIQSQTDHIT